MSWRALTLVALVLLAGALAAGVKWVLELREATAPPRPEAYVNASWVVYKHGPGHRTHVGRLRLDCKACHQADASQGFDRPGPAPCASCHEARGDIRHDLVSLDAEDRVVGAPKGAHAEQARTPVRELSNCLDCHGFGPEPAQTAQDCMRCHEATQGEVAAIVTHELAPCAECHAVHDNAVRPLPCTQCHEQQVQHAHASADVATQCRDCHEVHAAASFAREQCVKCHGPAGEHAVPASAEFGQHTCIGCHKPHSFEKQQAVACQSCHQGLALLHGHEGRSCTDCHSPHAARESVQRENLCSDCHRTVKLEHGPAEHGGGAPCVGCHTPHPAAGQALSASDRCTTCHAGVGGERHVAHAAKVQCTDCHKPHTFELASASTSLCQECHAPQLRAFAEQREHKACAGCHSALPHGPDLGPVACASCHAQQNSQVRKGHATCTGCHDAHTSGVAGNRCQSCHADEAAHHPRGHSDCTSCHEAHSGNTPAKVLECSQCHARSTLPSLHQVPDHQKDCLSCHEAHGTSRPGERGRCLACHEDQEAHQPEASVCNGCHTFIGPQHGGKAR